MLQHKHFGKLRDHQHTSYAGLVFVLLLTGTVLLASSWTAYAAPPAVNPQSGSVGLSGTVRGPAPRVAATILTPRSGSRISIIPITISGTCPAGTYVSIDRNGVFGGAATCQDDGTFSLLVDLFAGTNALVAKVADALGQFGPDSAVVNVFYDAPSLAVPGGQQSKQLFLQTSTTVLAGSPGVALTRQFTIVGGVSPYAVSWSWGDDATSLQSAASEGPFSNTHSYERPGTYRLVVRVTDATGNSAYMEVLDVVNGPAETIGASKGNGSGALPGMLLPAWPIFVLAVIMVLFFWLGERREVHKLRKRRLLLRVPLT